MKQNCEAALSTWSGALSGLVQDRERLDTQIQWVAAIVKGLEGLAGKEKKLKSLSDARLTEACCEVLKSDYIFLEPMKIRDGLIERGYDLGRYTNPLAAIHVTLKRLAEKEKAECKTEGAKTVYRWKPIRFPRVPKRFPREPKEKGRAQG